ncbi:MAG: hypothetical protein ACYCV5_00080 [Acidimicrobiales bacterium]|jgi:hypothetical protein
MTIKGANLICCDIDTCLVEVAMPMPVTNHQRPANTRPDDEPLRTWAEGHNWRVDAAGRDLCPFHAGFCPEDGCGMPLTDRGIALVGTAMVNQSWPAVGCAAVHRFVRLTGTRLPDVESDPKQAGSSPTTGCSTAAGADPLRPCSVVLQPPWGLCYRGGSTMVG